jgi:hypothetical protein
LEAYPAQKIVKENTEAQKISKKNTPAQKNISKRKTRGEQILKKNTPAHNAVSDTSLSRMPVRPQKLERNVSHARVWNSPP